MSGGKILLAGGAGGATAIPGSPGAGGSFSMTGGTFNFNAGQVTGNTAIVPSAPIALVAATMNVSAGMLNTTAGEFGISNGATLNLSGGVMNASTVTLNSSAFGFTGGTLHATTFNGNLTNAGGTLAPGASPAKLSVNGNYAQSAGALEIELGGPSSGQSDKLSVSGTATLGAALNVSFINGFVPQAGNLFDILDWGTLSGTFATLNLPGGGLTWNTSQLYTTGTLSVGGLLGDYNLNGKVDSADYVVWRNTLGQTGTGLAADGDFNNVIDAGDFAVFRGHFGETAGMRTGAASNVVVPEPASVLLMLFGVFVVNIRQRQK